MHLTLWAVQATETGHGPQGIVLLKGEESARVVSLRRVERGRVQIMEECDGFFSVTLSPDDAKQALREAIAWIDGQCGFTPPPGS